MKRNRFFIQLLGIGMLFGTVSCSQISSYVDSEGDNAILTSEDGASGDAADTDSLAMDVIEIWEGDSVKFEFEGNFTFHMGNPEPDLPESINIISQEFEWVLEGDSTRILIIEGIDGGDEQLGLQRAENIKELLAGHGVHDERIITKAIPGNMGYDSQGVSKHGLKFELAHKEGQRAIVPTEEFMEVPAELASSHTVQFMWGSDKVRMTRDLKSFIKEAKVYLNTHTGHKVFVFGHTDALGSAKDNMRTSERRAQAVADFLQEQGIPGNRIKIKAEGEHDPVADNDTKEGRKKNRRVEIEIR